MRATRQLCKKIALVLSLCLLLAWVFLGAGTSLAWFSDTSPEMNNIFHFAELDLEVEYRLDDGSYAPIDGKTDIFDDGALYEPGYVQVVYLRVTNQGNVPLLFDTAVNVTGYTPGINRYGRTFNLQDYLLFGVASAPTEQELTAAVADREAAKALAGTRLNNYTTDRVELAERESTYLALIVRMPEPVGNEANYAAGSAVPTVELGIIASATQLAD